MAKVTNVTPTGITSMIEDGVSAVVYHLTARHSDRVRYVVRMRHDAELIGEFDDYGQAMSAAAAACKARSKVLRPN